MNIDLHIHTHHSDGTFSTVDLLKSIKDFNVDLFSVTDHDSVGFYKDLSSLNVDLKDIGCVPGIEITCQHNNTIRDILWYGIDIDKINQWLESHYSFDNRLRKQKRILAHLKDAFRRHQVYFDENLDVHDGKKSEAYITMLMNVAKYQSNIEKLPMIANISDFYINHFTNVHSEFYANESIDAPTIKEAIDLIHFAGGLAFLAHPYKYRMDESDTMLLIDLAIQSGIDGIEVYHTSHNQKHIEKLYDIVHQNNLYISGGSDFHGDIKPNIHLCHGNNNVFVPYNEIKTWTNPIFQK